MYPSLRAKCRGRCETVDAWYKYKQLVAPVGQLALGKLARHTFAIPQPACSTMKHNRIYIAGHCGMVGSAIFRAVERSATANDSVIVRTHAELDLTDQRAVRDFFNDQRPTHVYLAAARVGGIHANQERPAEFLYENLMIEANVVDAAFRSGTRRLLMLGSSCIYPRMAEQPITEQSLLTGPLEPTNEPYAIAKIAGLKLCDSYNRQYGESHGVDFRALMPANLYGPGDNYRIEDSHVIPALIRRLHEAAQSSMPTVTVWGSGRPRREFLFVDDLASACLHVMRISREEYSDALAPGVDHLNVGTGSDVTIAELAHAIARVVGYRGELVFDAEKPDGTPRKLTDSSRVRSLGWAPRTSLSEGLQLAYEDFLQGRNRH